MNKDVQSSFHIVVTFFKARYVPESIASLYLETIKIIVNLSDRRMSFTENAERNSSPAAEQHISAICL